MSSNASQTWVFTGRITLLAATLGLGVGLYEAVFLHFIPRVSGLTRSDVGSLIWFVAPVAASLCFALVGFVVGLGAAGLRSSAASMVAVATLWGLAGAYMATAVELSHGLAGWLTRGRDLATPATWFLVVFTWALLTSWVWRKRTSNFSGGQPPFPLRLIVVGLLLGIVALVAGLRLQITTLATRLPSPKTNSADPQRAPNIVLITLDTVRADHLSAYGYPRPTSPNLDRLAAEGVLFENAVSPSSWTLPSFSSMFTGLLPHQHGANSITPLEEGPRTLAEILRSQGYRTAGFNANLGYGLAGWGIAQGFETYDDGSSSFRHNLATTVIGHVLVSPAYNHFVRYNEIERRDARQLNRQVYGWLRHHSDRPYFLFVNYFDAHRPYSATPPYDTRFGPISKDLLQKMDSLQYGRLAEPLREDERASLTNAYDNCLEFLDSQLGELLRFLRSSPEWSNTYVIVTSDHGDGFGEHGTYDHGWNLYRELLHVPLIITGPGIPPGLRIAHLARTREIFPTALDMTLNTEGPFSRTSLRRFWRTGYQPQPFDEMIISELVEYQPSHGRTGTISLMTPEWHLLYAWRGRSELYHWPTDPQEMNDVADSPEGQRVAEALSEHLYQIVEKSVRPWRGLPYLAALDRPSYSILRQAIRVENWNTVRASGEPRIGLSQAYFPPDPSSEPRKKDRADEEMIRSIPYY